MDSPLSGSTVFSIAAEANKRRTLVQSPAYAKYYIAKRHNQS